MFYAIKKENAFNAHLSYSTKLNNCKGNPVYSQSTNLIYIHSCGAVLYTLLT